MHKIGTANSVLDLVSQLHAFLTAQGSAFGQSRRGAGNGTFINYSGGPQSRAERVTARATTATAFEVSGSRSGRLGTAYVGVPFVSDHVAFTIEGGAAAFRAGDELSIQTAPPWLALRADQGGYIWQAPGNDGQQAVFVGVLPPTAGSFLRIDGFTGYAAGAAFTAQPGRPSLNIFSNGIAMAAGSQPFWFVADGRRVIVVVRPAAGAYQTAYLGLGDALVDNISYPYPLIVGGTALDSVAYTTTSYKNVAFLRSEYEQLMLRVPPGGTGRFDGWAAHTVNNQGTGGALIHPTSGNSLGLMRMNLDGSVPLNPVTLRDDVLKRSLVQVAGVHAIPAGLAAETLLDVGGIKHLVVRNATRSGPNDHFTVALD